MQRHTSAQEYTDQMAFGETPEGNKGQQSEFLELKSGQRPGSSKGSESNKLLSVLPVHLNQALANF